MAGDMPGDFGEGSTSHPRTAGQWAPAYPTQPASRSRTWPAVALAAIALVVAVAALIVALIRSAPAVPARTATVPTYTAAEAAATHKQLCDTYKLAALAVRVDTASNDKALARIATTNGAVMLNIAAANPALGAEDREAARALVTAYVTVTAKSSAGVANDAEYQAASDDVIAKDAVMKKVCGGG
jgi:hypothetical protein